MYLIEEIIMKRLLVITADDFGFSKERNEGVMEAYNNGAVKSASLLLNCTGTVHAVESARNTGLTLGLHLNLTEGKPVGGEYKTLTSCDGIFQGMIGTREALDNGQIDLTEIETEIDSQIKYYKELVGEKPAYVDGHQHIHLHPVVVPIFAKLLSKHGIAVTRMPIEINLDLNAKPWLHHSPKLDLLNIFVKEAKSSIPVLQQNNIRTSACFTGLSTMSAAMTTESLQAVILEAFESVEPTHQGTSVACELMTHPGYPTPMDYGGFSWGTDDFGNSKDRVHELQVLSSAAMKNFYKTHNMELASHREL
ncbi:hypothetical protein EGW08_006457 [Elysia chlorotica]|uniref:Carbohydrate deacetylase n=1 Tax=Elysia chlorotica TaxID=188477 RepID=A0A3S1HTF4_ELYCH|nr:hypothetical protein EGW08_006457 [Elysia chlorotica]